ncbi:helix-turn-helix domain-containing protein [Streptomyces syringium]|uniref:helix-turn-helix domain-containing protein n=1 Tax=Streptomyces syringium TaxID=76729 RepID=UPI00365956D4
MTGYCRPPDLTTLHRTSSSPWDPSAAHPSNVPATASRPGRGVPRLGAAKRLWLRGEAWPVDPRRAHRLAEMRKELGLTQSEVAARMHVRQERVSAIERGNANATEVGTVAAYIAALGGSLEIVANFNGTRVVVA